MNYERREMSMGTIISIGLIACMLFSVVGTCIGTYNSMVNLQEDVELAQANVQTMMQRRLELIPDLVETTKAAAEHEEKIFEDIANARAALNSSFESGDAQAIDDANQQLDNAIDAMMIVIHENYPSISASQQYTTLMDQLEGSVNRISVARENYNTAVNSYNRVIRNFPGSILAGVFGFERIEPFKADEVANTTTMVDFD